MINPKHFFVIGNGGGGTSLLRGLLNAHTQLEVLFEENKGGREKPAEKEIAHWVELSEKSDLKWANKVPLEQFISRGWSDDDIISLSDYFKLVWLIRRFSRYWKGKAHGVYEKNWHWSQALYWRIREKYPDRIIQVSFEDLLLRTEIELHRICVFLDIEYEATMLEGTNDTGQGSYNQATINQEKI